MIRFHSVRAFVPPKVRSFVRPARLAGRRARQTLALQWERQRLTWRIRFHGFSDGIVVVEDAYGSRFTLYPWDRSSAHYRITHHGGDVLPGMLLLIKPGDVVFDVGAHFGLYAALAGVLCGATGKVHAFEPVPEACWRLRETVALNRLENVVPIQKALGEKVGTVTINVFDDPAALSWSTRGHPVMGPKGKRPTESIDVPCDTIDNFVEENEIDRIQFLKVDVEGFEKSVLMGAEDTLDQRRVDVVCFEVSEAQLKGAGTEAGETFEFLKDHGYLTYRFRPPTKGREGVFKGPLDDADSPFANYFASWRDLRTVQPAPRSWAAS
jgi:FkbM family methyltransferase